MKINLSFLARQKFRFDLGQSFLTVINFAFVVVAASGTLAQVAHLRTRTMLVIAVPAAVAGVWLLGYTLDRMRFSQAYQEEQNRRNEMLRAACLREGIPLDPSDDWMFSGHGKVSSRLEAFASRPQEAKCCHSQIIPNHPLFMTEDLGPDVAPPGEKRVIA